MPPTIYKEFSWQLFLALYYLKKELVSWILLRMGIVLSFNSLNKGRQENMCGCNNCFCTNSLEPKQNSQLERRQFEHHHLQAVYPAKWPSEDMPFVQHLQRSQHVIKEPSLFFLLHSAPIASHGICSN